MRAFLKRGGGTFSQSATGAGEAVLLGWSSREDVIPAECITSVRLSLVREMWPMLRSAAGRFFTSPSHRRRGS